MLKARWSRSNASATHSASRVLTAAAGPCRCLAANSRFLATRSSSAVGQASSFDFLGGGVSLTRKGGIAIDRKTGATSVPGVCAGGDVALDGPESIIAACEDGRRAAESICAQFGVTYVEPPSQMPVLSNDEIIDVKHVRAQKIELVEPDCLPVPARTGFDMIELTFTPSQAVAEAKRCVQCTTFCDKCVEVCPNRANHTFLMEALQTRSPRARGTMAAA